MTPRERLLAHLLAEPFCDVQDTFFRVFGIHAKEAMAQKIASVPDEWLIEILLAEFESVDNAMRRTVS